MEAIPKNMDLEIWKDIEGYEGIYQISSLGRVKSLERNIKGHGSSWLKDESLLRLCLDKKGYCIVRLSRNNLKQTFKVHRLVALNFIPNPENKPQINHKDCIKLNNEYGNLEWCNNSENQLHAFSHGLNSHTINHTIANRVQGFNRRRLSGENVSEMKSMRVSGFTYREISEKYSISGKMAEQIIKGVKYKPSNIIEHECK